MATALFSACNNTTPRTDENQATAAMPEEAQPQQEKTKTILFFGNSLTAGLGLDNPNDAFPGLIQQRIDSLGLPYRVINAGVSGETTAGGNERIDWLLNEEIHVFVLELGANDGLRGIPTEETRKNLQHIVDKVKAKYPECKLILAGMMVPPSMGGAYGQAFTALFPELAAENQMTLIPFLLEGVAGETTLNQRDGIHPTEAGHQMMADHVWKVLAPLL